VVPSQAVWLGLGPAVRVAGMGGAGGHSEACLTGSCHRKFVRNRCHYCGREGYDEPLRDTVAWFCLPCLLRRIFPHFTPLHRRIFIWFYLVFALLTLLILLPGSISGHGEPLSSSIWGVFLAFAGPFTGIASRRFDSAYGVPGIVPCCSVLLGAGLMLQLVPLPRGGRWVRIPAWCVGLLGWFLGTLLSTLVANS
jgi:hypothetical protein